MSDFEGGMVPRVNAGPARAGGAGLRPLFHVDDVNLDELAVEGLLQIFDIGYDELFEVGDHAPVLSVAVQGDLCASVDLDGLRVIDRENAVADFVLPIEEEVGGGRRDPDAVDVVCGIVGGATDVEVFSDLLSVFVHHGFDDSTEAKGDFVATAGFTSELLFDGEVIGGFWIAGDEAGGAVLPVFGVFGHWIFAGELESEPIECCGRVGWVDGLGCWRGWERGEREGCESGAK